jgi:hypothetical protein
LSGFLSVPVVAVATTQRNSATAAARPWRWARMAEPAASSSALARAARGAVAAEMPPWTPIMIGSLYGEELAGLGQFGLHGLEIRLAAQAWVDGHHQQDVDLVEDMWTQVSGVAEFRVTPDRSA